MNPGKYFDDFDEMSINAVPKKSIYITNQMINYKIVDNPSLAPVSPIDVRIDCSKSWLLGLSEISVQGLKNVSRCNFSSWLQLLERATIERRFSLHLRNQGGGEGKSWLRYWSDDSFLGSRVVRDRCLYNSLDKTHSTKPIGYSMRN